MKYKPFSGTVIRGVDLGARFGVATANIDTDFSQISMEEGVYFVEVQISAPLTLRESQGSGELSKTEGLKEEVCEKNEARLIPAIMHYGPRKTFGGDKSIEIHILDFSGDLYGKTLQVSARKFYRPIKKFPNADVLFTQIENDIIKAKKYFLRNICKKKWSLVDDETKEIWVQKTMQKLSDLESFAAAKNVLLFVPLCDEIPLSEDVFYRFPDKKFFFPRVDIVTKNMQFFVSYWDELIAGAYTLEPPKTGEMFVSTTTEKTLVFVPALAVSRDGKRLGRGAGFYDRFLSECVGNDLVSTISVQPAFAVFENLPVEMHDQVLDEVLVV